MTGGLKVRVTHAELSGGVANGEASLAGEEDVCACENFIEEEKCELVLQDRCR